MATRKKHDESFQQTDTWLITYSDLITLLLVFFLLLLASSVFDQSKYETLVKSIQESELGTNEFVSPFEILEQNLQQAIEQKQLKNQINVDRHPLGLTIELTDESLFASGEATLKPSADAIIKTIADSLLKMQQQGQQLEIEIEGHTDDIPINNEEFSSNWELSVFRAIDVLNRLIQYNISAEQLKIAGYGEIRPKVPNRDSNGIPIVQNQAKNRRIEIKVLRKDNRFSNKETNPTNTSINESIEQ